MSFRTNHRPLKWSKKEIIGHLIDSKQLISFWEIYNKQILSIVSLIPNEGLLKEITTSDNEKLTLVFIFNDYVEHLEHHMRQVVQYK